jgi:ATP-dependent helicase/nuclease subunit A
LPEWASRKAPQVERPPLMLKPSDLGGDKIIANATQGNDEQAAMLRGSRIHLLLEHLPGVDKAMRKQVATRLLPTSDDAAGIQDIDALLAKVGAILDSPDLAFLFASNSLAEVPVTAHIHNRPLYGIIDRLIVDDQRILAIDYKTNAAIPETPEQVPEGILRQMGAYAEALEQIYPGRLVETAILWTEAPLLMMLPRQVVAGALERAAAS